MRTSSDFFTQDPTSFESLDDPFIPRPTVPLVPNQISVKKITPPLPKVHYPVYTPPPPPQTSALEQVQAAIQKEVTELQQKKPSLDQLIQNAVKQKIQHDYEREQQKVVVMKKAAAPKPLQIAVTPPVNKPFQQPKLWWPSKQEVIIEKLAKQKNIPPVSPEIKPIPPPISAVTNTPIKRVPPITPIRSSLATPQAMVKTAFHVSNHFINYFLFSINQESDPYNDSNRQKVIYAVKVGAYLSSLIGIFELTRNIRIGSGANGVLEAMGIFLISAILFFFGENLTILIKPVNPYQVHEVV